MEKIHNISNLRDRRKELRKKSTPQECILWAQLRQKKLGWKFYRQHSIGYYIVDFYCPKAQLIIELDGSVHLDKDVSEYDQIRGRELEELDYRILRFWNSEVKNNLSWVIENIKQKLPPPPTPPQREGEEAFHT